MASSWRTTAVEAEVVTLSKWRTTRVAAEIAAGNAVWRSTRVAAELTTSLTAPIADAGPALSVGAGEYVKLDGTNSQGTGAPVTGYTWRLVSTTAGTATLSSTTSSTPTFRAPISAAGGVMTFGLIVHDANGLNSTEVQVAVSVAPADLAVASSGNWKPAGLLTAASSGWY